MSKFASAWFVPYAFYQGLVRRFPDLVIDYQYSCWETGFIGFGRMTLDTVDEQPVHCSYNTPEDLNEGFSYSQKGAGRCGQEIHISSMTIRQVYIVTMREKVMRRMPGYILKRE